MDAKSILASRTLWTQVVGAVVLLVPLVTGKAQVIDADTQSAVVAGIIFVVNVILRLVTNQPVTLP